MWTLHVGASTRKGRFRKKESGAESATAAEEQSGALAGSVSRCQVCQSVRSINGCQHESVISGYVPAGEVSPSMPGIACRPSCNVR